MSFNRPDREWLVAVRNGLLAYEELLETAATYEVRLEELGESSPLPDEPDFDTVEALVVELQQRFLWETWKAT